MFGCTLPGSQTPKVNVSSRDHPATFIVVRSDEELASIGPHCHLAPWSICVCQASPMSSSGPVVRCGEAPQREPSRPSAARVLPTSGERWSHKIESTRAVNLNACFFFCFFLWLWLWLLWLLWLFRKRTEKRCVYPHRTELQRQ